MVKITVSEQNSNNLSVAYIYNTLSTYLYLCGAKADITFDDTRTNLVMTAEKRYNTYIRKYTEEKIADVIAVGYKYSVFKNNIKPIGLSELDIEILLCALISADFEEDKKYIVKKIKDIKVYSIDGFFNFRLNTLKNKWLGIVDCIPQCFTDKDLSDFLDYLFEERGKLIVKYKDGELFDSKFNKLKRVGLIDTSFSSNSLVKELLLSGATYIECFGTPPPEFCKILQKYYFNRVIFPS